MPHFCRTVIRCIYWLSFEYIDFWPKTHNRRNFLTELSNISQLPVQNIDLGIYDRKLQNCQYPTQYVFAATAEKHSRRLSFIIHNLGLPGGGCELYFSSLAPTCFFPDDKLVPGTLGLPRVRSFCCRFCGALALLSLG